MHLQNKYSMNKSKVIKQKKKKKRENKILPCEECELHISTFNKKNKQLKKILPVCAWGEDWERTDTMIFQTPSQNQGKRRVYNLPLSTEKGRSPV